MSVRITTPNSTAARVRAVRVVSQVKGDTMRIHHAVDEREARLVAGEWERGYYFHTAGRLIHFEGEET